MRRSFYEETTRKISLDKNVTICDAVNSLRERIDSGNKWKVNLYFYDEESTDECKQRFFDGESAVDGDELFFKHVIRDDLLKYPNDPEVVVNYWVSSRGALI